MEQDVSCLWETSIGRTKQDQRKRNSGLQSVIPASCRPWNVTVNVWWRGGKLIRITDQCTLRLRPICTFLMLNGHWLKKRTITLHRKAICFTNASIGGWESASDDLPPALYSSSMPLRCHFQQFNVQQYLLSTCPKLEMLLKYKAGDKRTKMTAIVLPCKIWDEEILIYFHVKNMVTWTLAADSQSCRFLPYFADVFFPPVIPEYKAYSAVICNLFM